MIISDIEVLEYETKEDRKPRLSNALELRLRNRPTKEALADRVILDDSFLAARLVTSIFNLEILKPFLLVPDLKQCYVFENW